MQNPVPRPGRVTAKEAGEKPGWRAPPPPPLRTDRQMRAPLDIVVEQRLDKNTRTTKFHVSEPVKVHDIYGFIVELRERFTFPKLADLIAFLDMHDYRYVLASRGHWRLP